ncbi:MAG: M36 family metallopeptidase, partial [Bacteroidota bacterium]
MSKTVREAGAVTLILLLLTTLSFSQAMPEAVVRYIEKNRDKWGLLAEDVAGLKVTDSHVSSTSGLLHVYLQQQVEGIPVRKGLASVHLTPEGEVFHENIGFVAHLKEKIETTEMALPPEEAVKNAAVYLYFPIGRQVKLIEKHQGGAARLEYFPEEKKPGITIWASPAFDLNEQGRLRPCWFLVFPSPNETDVWEICIDAVTGKELSRFNRTVHCQFHATPATPNPDCQVETHSIPLHKIKTPETKFDPKFQSRNSYHLKQFTSGTDPDLGIVPVFSLHRTAHPSLLKSNLQHSFFQSTLDTPFRKFQTFGKVGLSNPLSFNGQYNIFPLPIESPAYGTRSLKLGIDIIDATASPYGWHDTNVPGAVPEFGYTKGNNAYAFYAPAGAATEPLAVAIVRDPITGLFLTGNVPWPGDLDFNYTHDLDEPLGTAFIEDAVTNLFAWNNICHDVYYLYGFDEAAGNFQATNLTGDGVGSDYVLARAQDGSGLNNASFTTPLQDGQKPTMRMFLWDTALPDHVLDGDFDNAIIAHEYGHGVSFRLVCPANASSCLGNFEQGGEGWSDFFGLMLTLRDADGDGTLEENQPGEGIRSIGAYVLNQSANGTGIRPRFYSTDMDCMANPTYCNDFTYGQLADLPYPHGTGFLWCTMLWEMTWELINAYGFEPNIYNTASMAGNIRAMKIVMEGLKMTDCDPTFPQMRDAILIANLALYGGAGENLIWEAFARRGLGYSAVAGGIEAFDNPTMHVTKTVDKTAAEVGESITYTITVKNNSDAPLTTVNISDPVPANLDVTSVSDGGIVQNGVVIYPTIASIPVGGEITRTFSGIINAASWTTIEWDEPVESTLPPGFSADPTWLTDTQYPNPNTTSTTSWWHLDPTVIIDASLRLTLTLNPAKNNHLSFWQWFDVEGTADGGVLEIETAPNTWADLGSRIIKNGYTNVIFAQLVTPIGVPVNVNPLSGRAAFTGYSGGYVNTIVDLSGYDGQQTLRFRFGSDLTLTNQTCNAAGPTGGDACDGWFLDDFKLLDLKNMENTASATCQEGYAESGDVGQVGTIYYEAGALPVELIWFSAQAKAPHILLNWTTATETNNAGFEL